MGHEVKEGDENPDAGQDVHDGELRFVGVESPVGFVMIADVKRSLQMRVLETERPLENPQELELTGQGAAVSEEGETVGICADHRVPDL